MPARVFIVGILNCTPDSFSDGDPAHTADALTCRAQQLIDDGADVLDLGGDSTRPGSRCCGIEEEWRRIAPILKAIAHKIPCSVDTHHAEVARRAIAEGASFINDISGGSDPLMLPLVVAEKVSYIAMYNPHGEPHLFGDGLALDSVVGVLTAWAHQFTAGFIAAGGSPEQLVLDTGMGAFLSKDSDVSWTVLRHYEKLPWPKGGAMLGCSRKGFLKRDGETSVLDRDDLTARCGMQVACAMSAIAPLYLRVHNVAMQRAALDGIR